MDACASISDSEGPEQPLALAQLLRIAFREAVDRRRRAGSRKTESLTPVPPPSAVQATQDLFNHKRILNTDNDPGRAVFIGPPQALQTRYPPGCTHINAWAGPPARPD